MTDAPKMDAPKLEDAPKSIRDNPLISQWVGFGEAGVARVRTGRVELGQGVLTALTQIAADELDLPPERIRLISGDTRETPDEGFTSGSFSIEVGGRALRLAVSGARTLMLAEAAELLQTRPETLAIVEGVVHRPEGPTDLSYWTLAPSVDLAKPALDHARPKPPAQRRVAGVSLPRLDLPEKLAGGGFIHDMTLDGMLHGRAVHPPSPVRRLLRADLDGLAERHGLAALVRDGSFLGVVAAREEQALAAAAELARRCEWSVPDAPADPMATLIAALDRTEGAETTFERGDPDAAEGERLETLVTRPYIAHGAIGPSCAVALWQGERLTVWSHGQGVYPLRKALAVALRLPEASIEVIHRPGSGCYGHNGADDAALDAALLARATPNRPVKLVWSRADELGRSPLGTGGAVRAEATVGPDRKLRGFTMEIAGQPFGHRPGRHGGPNLLAALYLETPHPPPAPLDIVDGAERNGKPPYVVPNLRVRKRMVADLPMRTSSLRTLGAYLNVFAIETLMDDIAVHLGADPVAFRLENLEDPRARAVIERVAVLCGWPGESAAGRGEGRGLGLGFARYKDKSAYCAVAARVETGVDIRVTHCWAAVDAGEIVNPDGVVNQIEGGMVQAASWTLKEAVTFEGDRVSSLDWSAYPILTFSETPETFVELLPRPDLPPLGVGEAAHGPTAAAIGNAVRNALGLRVRRLPITPEAVNAALND